MKASPLCQHSVAGSKACSGAWDKNICKAHHFLTSPFQHFLPKAVCADSSAVTATSDLQPHPANTLGAHVLMQALQGGGGTYSDSLKPMGIAHLFKVRSGLQRAVIIPHAGARRSWICLWNYIILQQWKKIDVLWSQLHRCWAMLETTTWFCFDF